MLRVGLIHLDTIARYLAEAATQGIDILGFPEMCLTGYADPARYPEAVLRLDGPEVARLLEITNNWQTGHQWWTDECQKYSSRYAQDYGLWILVATQAGRTIDEDFPGGGFVYAPSGERVFATPEWSPGAVFLELDLETGRLFEILSQDIDVLPDSIAHRSRAHGG